MAGPPAHDRTMFQMELIQIKMAIAFCCMINRVEVGEFSEKGAGVLGERMEKDLIQNVTHELR